MGSLLLKLENVFLTENNVEKILKNLFLNDVSNWQLKLRKIKGNLNFFIIVSAVQIKSWFGFLYGNTSQT